MQRLRILAEKARLPPARQVTDDTSVLTLKNLVLEPLCRWHEGRVGPGLFAAWRHEDAGHRWHFRIRAGATFHDGLACTPEHILAFIDGLLTARDTFGMPWSYARYFAGARFTAASADTIQVETPQPFADLPEVFSEFYPSRDDASGQAILGTGPFRVTDYLAETRVELLGPGGRITIQAEPSAEARLHALRTGATDVALNLERCATRLDFTEDFDWLRAENTLSVMYFLNAGGGLFAHPDARRAINHAIDRRAIIEEIFFGLATPAATIVSPHHLGARAAALAPIPYDPEAAKRLFDAASGPVLIRTPTFMPDRAEQVSQAIAASLSAIGIASHIEVQPDRPEYAREAGRRHIGDMAIFDSSPHSTFRILNDKISSAVQAVWWQGHDDPVLEPLIAAANRTMDDAAREQAYAACLMRLQANPPWLYLFHPIDVAGVREGIPGLRLDSLGVLHVTL